MILITSHGPTNVYPLKMNGQVAQLVNHRLCNREVAGSNPTACLVVG